MAEYTFISPGVFSREVDLTARPAVAVGTGPVIIGPRAKGPAMEPVLLRSEAMDVEVFGPPSSAGGDFSAYASKLFLRNSTAPLTFVRVLGMEGSGVTPGYEVGSAYAIGASGSNVIALIHASGAVTLQGTLTSSANALAINIAGYGSVTASLHRSDANYLKKILNTDPALYDTHKHYVFAVYDYVSKTPTAENAFFVSQVPASSNYQDGFLTGATTTVVSQPFGSTEYDLFGFGNRLAGDSANTEIKVSIEGIKKSGTPNQYEFGSFTVVVRKFDDTDRNPVVLESFPNCNLDPNSRNYILRRIGDRYKVWNSAQKKFDVFGDYPNQSKYIYVSPSTDLLNGNVPETALPFGFKGYRKLTAGAITDKASFPSLPLISTLVYKGQFNPKVYWGVEVSSNASGSVNHGVADRLKHLATAVMGASGTVESTFSLKHLSASVGNVSGFSTSTRLTEAQIAILSSSIAYTGSTVANPSGGGYLSLENIENTALAKFTFPMNDGFDGVNIHERDPFSPEDMVSATTYQAHAYRVALDMMSNADEHDLSELYLPGVHATVVTDYATDMVEDRGDTLYVMDLSGNTVDGVVADLTTRGVDSTYVTTYYPSVRLLDDTNSKIVTVPASTIIPAVYAYNDRVAFAWFAPAGMNRGGLSQYGVTEARDKLNRKDLDRLYENRINPIATFPGEGPTIWGQKTLKAVPSALDRINVRRMLLLVRKLIAKVGRTLVFEPNVQKTWQKFENKVNPIMDKLKQESGVDEFRVVLNSSTTTEDLIERNVMYGQIVLRPTRAAEFIALDFIVTNNVAAFAE